MLNNNLLVNISNNNSSIIINNPNDWIIENCKIQYSNEWGEEDIIDNINLSPNSSTSFHIEKNLNCVFELKIITNEKLIFEKKFNHICVLVCSTLEQDQITKECISSIRKFSNIDIIKFTINYTSKSDNCKVVHLKTSTENISISDICKLSKEFIYKKFILIDNNLVALNSKFIDISNDLQSLPIFSKTDEYEIGPFLSRELQITDELSSLGSDVIYFSKEHISIFEDISFFEKNSRVIEISTFESITKEIVLSSFFKSKNIDIPKSKVSTIINSIENLKSFLYESRPQDCVSFLRIENSLLRKKTFDKLKKSDFESKLISFYDSVNTQQVRKKKAIQIVSHSVNGPFVEIQAETTRMFEVSFLNSNNVVIYKTIVNGNMWTRLTKKFYQDYSVCIKEDGLTIYQEKFSLKDKRVYIALESSSLGDSLAWFPYVEEFRKKHDCQLIVSTFNNDLFEANYPRIQFVKPGEVVNNLSAMYCIGWFYAEDGNPNLDKCPYDFRNQPLQKTAADILGLEFEEIRPRLNIPVVEKQKRVGIAIHGTAQSKYWNNPTGWQEVTDYLISLGYEVVIYSKEGDGYMGNNHPGGANKFPAGSLTDLIKGMATCEFFIGIGSGLSWLAWAINLPIVLISGFSEDYTETQNNTWRVINKKVCTGCFNTHKLDPGDWNWCPVNKGTERQFECTKSITGDMVISEIDKLIYQLHPKYA
jgi:autotransporter strand-loop-strand O-heptosyltransferase